MNIKMKWRLFVHKVESIRIGLKNLYVWAPTIWKDRDYDYIYTINILKKKLELQAKSMENGWMDSGERDAQIVRTAIRLIDKVYNEEYFEGMFTSGILSGSDEYDEYIDYCIEQEAKAKKLLYKILSEKLDTWWN